MNDVKGNRSDTITPEVMIEKLRQALRRDGDFPANAKTVAELRQMTSDPKITANQVTEVILREPSLGVRVLHLVNSSFYRRAKPIMTVSQAVVQIGMRPLAEMCSGLVLLQRFVPAARRGGTFANCLRKTVLTSLLTSSITPVVGDSGRASKKEEHGYLAGTFAELGTLLLAFYFPQIYEAAGKRAELKHQELAQSIKEITGLSPLQLSIEVIDALQLPAFYKEVLAESDRLANGDPGEASPKPSTPLPPGSGAPEQGRIIKAVSAARTISEVVASNKPKQELDAALTLVHQRFGIDSKALGKILSELPQIFKDHCGAIDLQLPALPTYMATYRPAAEGETEEAQTAPVHDEVQFNQFVQEIRQAVENREPTASIITSVMETFAWALKFDRVLLMLVNAGKSKLVGRMLLGNVSNFDPRRFERVLTGQANAAAPDVLAFKESRPIYSGKPILPGGCPIAAVPIGFGQRALGVIYADRTAQDNKEVNAREQAAIGVLAELLDRSLALQG